MKRCTKCIMPDTRPRLTYDSKGICSACQWSIEKQGINWQSRLSKLTELCDSIRGKNKYDCIVPVSGGKDSTYVAHKMKYDYNLNVLTVTITPPLETDIVQKNLTNFLAHGYENIKVTPNPVLSLIINKKGFIEQGRPLLSWTSCLNSVMMQLATSLKVPLIMFGEDGETEYGGTMKLKDTPFYSINDAIDIYTYGNTVEQYKSWVPSGSNLSLWEYPSLEKMSEFPVNLAHWSYFENWSSNNNAQFAIENYEMQINEHRNTGTYTNFGQLDTPLYDLHAYFMYLKFGFGRCLQDACIDIRDHKINREEAISLVNKYDGEFNDHYTPLYLDYYKITRDEFDSVVEKHINKELFRKENDKWIPLFTVE